MAILIDIGHSFIKTILSHATGLERNSLRSFSVSDFDNLNNFLKESEHPVFFAGVLDPLSRKLKQSYPNAVEIFKKDIPLDTRYDRSMIGIDRLLVSYAAVKKWDGKDILIVDAGTLITIDVVDKSNVHLGGFILPSLDKAQDLCLDIIGKDICKTDVRNVNIGDKSSLPLNTDDAAQYGSCLSLLGAVYLLVDKLNPDICVFTGGGTKDIVDGIKRQIDCEVHVDEYLLFEAMRRIAYGT